MGQESWHKIAGLSVQGHSRQIPSSKPADKFSFSIFLPQNLIECNIIIGVTILLPLSYRTWHNQGSEYPIIFTTVAHAQRMGNIHVCIQVWVYSELS